MINLLKKYSKAILILLIGCTIISCGKKKYPPEYFFQDSNVIELCNVISNNDAIAMGNLLAQNIDINTVGKDGMTLLFWALKEKNKEAYEKLLKKGADPNVKITATSGKGQSVLFLVCRMKDNDYLKTTLKYVNKSSKIQLDKSVLSYVLLAINELSLEKVKLLVVAGADINTKAEEGIQKGMPPLISAASLNQFDIVYYLLNEGADPMIKADPILASSNKDDGLALIPLIERRNVLMSRKGFRYQYLRKCAKFLKAKGIKVDVSKPQKYPEAGVKQFYEE